MLVRSSGNEKNACKKKMVCNIKKLEKKDCKKILLVRKNCLQDKGYL